MTTTLQQATSAKRLAVYCGCCTAEIIIACAVVSFVLFSIVVIIIIVVVALPLALSLKGAKDDDNDDTYPVDKTIASA